MPNPARGLLLSLVSTSLLLASTLHAEEMDRAYMLETIEKRLHDDSARQAAITAGEDRALICQYCHGSDGNSLKPEVPNLAGQNASYLLDQIDKFATGKRDDYVMTPLAANFSPEDKINLAIFYYSQSVKKQDIDAALAAKGKSLFYDVCSKCHGAQGRGNQRLARLAGQQRVYVSNMLKTFRDNAKHPDTKVARRSFVMEGIVKDLSDAQIEAVAAYVAQMP